MWMVTAFSILILTTHTLNNPVDNQRVPSDIMDEFYQKLISTFDKFLDPKVTNKDVPSQKRNPKDDASNNTREKTPMTENTGSEKLKRDETVAENHLDEMEMNSE
ncbi:hypothetical protein TNIN_489901 [Trichonephila inaurata madagascariensis]|uniref:Uncharacterized protein n=1 Tax=Trichonephila inaurata madagascariensis TaxID=2747483 RepID=A0A8X6X0J6_9ARAC|nr:hypothetical protein TNIN_489901 [Trichonephila inaurata madagascariensis]